MRWFRLTLPLGVLVLMMAAAPVVLLTAPHSACSSSLTSLPGLDAEQVGNARLIVDVGARLGVPPQGRQIALMTGMQESTLRNLDYGDRDSLGLFQQRPSTGWGSAEQVRDLLYAARAFYGGPTSPTPNPGLLDIADWHLLEPTAAAQAVQRSAYPHAYARWEAAAGSWLLALSTKSPDCEQAGATAQTVIEAASKWIGTPYAWGGGDIDGPSHGIGHGSRTVGFDCSGLTRYAYGRAGIALPRTSRQQWSSPGARLTAFAQLQPGDLVFFAWNPSHPSTIHHVAIWLGRGAMLEAPRTGDVVKVTQGVAENRYWAPQFIGGLRPTP